MSQPTRRLTHFYTRAGATGLESCLGARELARVRNQPVDDVLVKVLNRTLPLNENFLNSAETVSSQTPVRTASAGSMRAARNAG